MKRIISEKQVKITNDNYRGLSFQTGKKHLWPAFHNDEPVWVLADLIDNKFCNHKRFKRKVYKGDLYLGLEELIK